MLAFRIDQDLHRIRIDRAASVSEVGHGDAFLLINACDEFLRRSSHAQARKERREAAHRTGVQVHRKVAEGRRSVGAIDSFSA